MNKCVFMRNHYQMILYGSPTPSDFYFMVEGTPSFPSSTSSTLSSTSTKSDAQSAPPELDQVFICEEYTNWVGIAQKQIPPE